MVEADSFASITDNPKAGDQRCPSLCPERTSRTRTIGHCRFTPTIVEVNSLLKAYTAGREHLSFLECGEGLLTADRSALNRSLVPDARHPSAAGKPALAPWGQQTKPAVQRRKPRSDGDDIECKVLQAVTLSLQAWSCWRSVCSQLCETLSVTGDVQRNVPAGWPMGTSSQRVLGVCLNCIFLVL